MFDQAWKLRDREIDTGGVHVVVLPGFLVSILRRWKSSSSLKFMFRKYTDNQQQQHTLDRCHQEDR